MIDSHIGYSFSNLLPASTGIKTRGRMMHKATKDIARKPAATTQAIHHLDRCCVTRILIKQNEIVNPNGSK